MVFATIISRVFEPVFLFLVLFFLALSRTTLTIPEILIYCGIVFFVVVFPSIGLLLRALRTKKISNWDISNRQQRVKALPLFLLFLIVGVVCISFVGNMQVTRFFLLFSLMNIIFFLITLWFKISGHMTTATFVIGTLIYWFGGYFWLLLFAVPILAWSRVVLKRHTVFQVVTGTMYGACMVCIGIYFHLL